MKRATILIASLAMIGFIGLAVADDHDRIDHFEGKPADTLPEAVANFSEYNHKLEAVLDGELSNEALVEIHELTYTLENALEKINEELARLADTLEELHVASEEYDAETALGKGREYLSVAREVIE